MINEVKTISRTTGQSGLVRLPADFAIPGETLFVTFHPHKCLMVFKNDAWTIVQDRLQQASHQNAPDRMLARLLQIFASVRVENDMNIEISEDFMNYAGLTDQVRLVSRGNHLQLIAPEYLAGYLGL